MKKLKPLPWKLISLLILIDLLRPISRALNIREGIWAFLVLLLITAAWITLVVIKKVSNPVLILGIAGGLYGALVIILVPIINIIEPSLISTQFRKLPWISLFTFGLFNNIIINAAHGIISGIIAKGIRSVQK